VIYICIPAHNEERTAGVLLWKIRQVMAEFRRDYQLFVLDDGSTDRTYEVLEPYTKVLPLEILRNERRQGHGASLEKLLREVVSRSTYPRRDVVVTLQADFTEEPMAIPTLVKRVEGGADLVVAAEQANGKSVPRAVRWVRRGLPWLERKYALPEQVTDPISGLRAYRVGLLKKTLNESDDRQLLKRNGWAASFELLLAVAPYTRRVEEMQFEARYDRRARPSRQSVWRAARDYFSFLRGE
jgi:glycosyltransferase involved in cell wall biosynthesis